MIGMRSVMERGLIVPTAIICFLFLNLGIAVGVVASEVNTLTLLKEQYGVCTTPGCIQAASDISNKIDPSVKPCDDFYGFVCGGFLNNTHIPDDNADVDTFSILRKKVEEQLRIIMEEPSSPTELKPFRLVKNLYSACMDLESIEAQSVNRFLEDLKKAGGCPVLEGNKWNNRKFHWIESLTKLKDLGYSSNNLFPVQVSQDEKNSTRYVLHVDKYRGSTAAGPYVNYYVDLMVDIAVILGADPEVARQDMIDVVQFMRNLQKISRSQAERRNGTYGYYPTTIAELSTSYPSIPWTKYINHMLPSSIRVKEKEIVILSSPDYISKLVQLLKHTPKRTHANFIMGKVIVSSIEYLNRRIKQRLFDYMRSLIGMAAMEPQWQKCVKLVSTQLPIGVGAMYVRKHSQKETKRHVVEMVDTIKNQFKQILLKADWMDDKTRKRAEEKIASMSSQIAYPDEFFDDRKIEDYYQGLEISDEHYLQGILNVSIFNNAESFRKLRKPVNKSDWVNYGNVAIVKALYSRFANRIVLPTGFLQGDFFNKDRPMYMNYAGIGSIIGREIIHGFDDQGRKLDGNGNLLDWWEPSTAAAYVDKVQCMIDQYGNYSVEEVGMKVNGITTRTENIADNGGRKLTYQAYNDWSVRHGQEPVLPDLPYTPKQMFWISLASRGCSVMRPQAIKWLMQYSEHTPAKIRILGSLTNSLEFAEDFNCPVGSKMNPIKKCTVW